MDIAIVGAGLSGLAAGIELTERGHSVEIYEASDGIGGRVRTDSIDGKLLDRGFQIFLTAYPEAQKVLDYEALDLRAFSPGAQIRYGQDFYRVSDPLREPKELLATLRSPVGGLADKLRLLRYRRSVLRGETDRIWSQPETSGLERFQRLGFSRDMITRFLQPLFAGITLDPQLSGPSNVVDFVFRMLSLGEASVPARGMGQIPQQLGNRLPEGSVHINHTVEEVDFNRLTVNGERVKADGVIVATDVTSAHALCPEVADLAWKGTTSVWMSAELPPYQQPILTLNGGSTDPINSLAVMSKVSPFYGSNGEATIVVSSPTVRPGLVEDIQAQLVDWYGKKTKLWKVLRVDEIRRAQPRATPKRRDGYSRLPSGVWVCGDHTLDPSINGALRSGRLAAQALMAAAEKKAL